MTAFTKVSSNITNAQKKQKEEYDHKHAPNELPVGVEVLLENMKQKQQKKGKFYPVWLSPYTISRHLGKKVYELKNIAGNIEDKGNCF